MSNKGKDNSKKTGFNKPLYLPLGIITSLLLTPALAYLFTLNVSNFEGARGFAYLYSIPMIFLGLLFSWFVIHKVFSKKQTFYGVSNKVFLVISLLLVFLYIGLYIDDNNQRKDRKRNRPKCREKIEDTYQGIIIDTARGNLKVRKMDSSYQEFKYHFNDDKLIRKNFFIGQKIYKKSNEEKFEVALKNGKTKKFTIPCYE